MKNKKVLMSVVLVALLAAGGAGAYVMGVFTPEDSALDGAARVDARPFLYVEMQPLVITYVKKKKTRYLQVRTQIVSRDEATISAINANAPMLQAVAFREATQIGVAKLRTHEGRDQLLTALRDGIPKLRVFENLTPPLELEDVILTSILEQ